MKNLRLQKNEEGYSLIVRLNDDLKPVAVEPYVVVSGYDEKTETWDSGSYHQDLEKALDDFNYGKRIGYERMLKIATSLIENALADSVINTLDTLTEFGVTKEEAEELGINTQEVLEDYDYDFE
jgi:hypothetical protein